MAARIFSIIICLSVALLSGYSSAQNNFFTTPATTSTYAPVDQAFAFDFQQKGRQLHLTWQIQPGYYLYQQKITVQAHNATLGHFDLPAGKSHKDEFFGTVEIYDQPLTLTIPIAQASDAGEVTVTYQGCAKAGFCYPPETRSVPLTSVKASQQADTASQQPSSAVQQPVTTQGSELPFSPLWALLLGITIAFTPCVLPMYPLITGLILGHDRPQSLRRLLALSLAYVQGMALTYTLLGLVVAAAGLQFQAALQNAWILIGLSVLFCLLAFSMFGFYSLQLPSSVQTRLAQLSNTQSGGSLTGVFIMGAVAGLICSPCTAAPLSAILLYIAQSGNVVAGGVTLYLYALGMGLPLIAVTLFGHRLLPRSGPWMQHIKEGFGFIILAMPLFLLQRLLSDVWEIRLWSLWAIAFLGWGFVLSLRHTHGLARIIQLVLLVALLVSARPLQDWVFDEARPAPTEQLTFQHINNMAELHAALTQARGKKVMLDFYADWCIACKEFEKQTFSDPAVQRQLADMVLLQANVTANNQDDVALFKALQIQGLPTIIFYGEQGTELAGQRIHGFMDAGRFMQHLQQITEHSSTKNAVKSAD
ncbi:MAG: protein-disulfide reductase DsbD [Enterobacteriaceae bacterium]